MPVQPVPSNIVVPFIGMSFDSTLSGAESSDVPYQILVIGQRLSTGTVAAEVPYLATSADEVGLKSGFGSMLYLMAVLVFKNNLTVPVVFVGLDDAGTATQGTYAWSLSGTATASGEYVTYIQGNRYAVSVSIGDTASDVQDSLVALITADANYLPCTAANSTGTITATINNAGIAADDLDIRFHAAQGELLPAGLTLSTVTKTAGTVDPDIADALAVLGDTWYTHIVNPYTDTSNMDTLEDYAVSVDSALVMHDFMAFQAIRDTRSNLITYGQVSSRNSKSMVALPAYQRRQSTYQIAAAVCAATAVSVMEDPAYPLHRMLINGITALDTADRWDLVERNQLALAGFSTFTDDNGVRTEATHTMYLTNDSGAADTAYRAQNTVFILSESRYLFVNQIQTKYGRAKLADNVDNIEPNQIVMTPETGRDEAIVWFKDLQRKARFEPGTNALNTFKQYLQVWRDSDNANRLNWLLPPNIINQFVVGSAINQFRI